MTFTPRARLSVSISIIALYWLYAAASSTRAPSLPDEFSTFVWRIALTKLVVLLVVVALLKLERADFGQLGVTGKDWMKRTGAGLLYGFGMFLVFNVGLSSVMTGMFPRAPEQGPSVMSFFADSRNLLLWIPIGILAGGVVEEMQRIFVITRFERWMGRPGLVFAVIVSSAVFGLGHLYQGPGSAISTGMSGIVFCLLYLRRRSALEPMVAHAFSDVLAVIAATLLLGTDSVTNQ